MIKQYRDFLSNLGIDTNKLSNSNLLITALTHKSFSADHEGTITHNERLEFLGDSVVGLVVNTLLFKLFPEFTESSLTQYKIALVREETLARAARDIGLDKTIRVGQGEERRKGRENETILCDCLEALVGYLYIDGGRDIAFSFVERYVFCYIETLTVEQIRSYKSLLQELSQKHYKVTPTYTENEIERDDSKNHIMYESVITLQGKQIGYGQGLNKKKAQEIAAKSGYEYLQEHTNDIN